MRLAPNDRDLTLAERAEVTKLRLEQGTAIARQWRELDDLRAVADREAERADERERSAKYAADRLTEMLAVARFCPDARA